MYSWSREDYVEQLRIVLGKLGEHILVPNGVGVVSGKRKKTKKGGKHIPLE